MILSHNAHLNDDYEVILFMPELTNVNELHTVSYEQAETVVYHHGAIIKCVAAPGTDSTSTSTVYGKNFDSQHGFDSILAQLKNPGTFRPTTKLNDCTNRNLIFNPPADEFAKAIEIIKSQDKQWAALLREGMPSSTVENARSIQRKINLLELRYGLEERPKKRIEKLEIALSRLIPMNAREALPSATRWWQKRDIFNERGAAKSTEFCKKMPGSLLPPSGRMHLQYPVGKENESVAFLFNLAECKQPLKYVFNACPINAYPNRNEENQQPWLGRLISQEEESFLRERALHQSLSSAFSELGAFPFGPQVGTPEEIDDLFGIDMQQHNAMYQRYTDTHTQEDPTALRRNCFNEEPEEGDHQGTFNLLSMLTTLEYIRNDQQDDSRNNIISKTNQLFFKMQKKALIGISAVTNTLENRLSAQYRQLLVIHELGIHLPLFIHSPKAGLSRYNIHQQRNDRLTAERKLHHGKGSAMLSELLLGINRFKIDSLTWDKTDLAHQIAAILENNSAEIAQAKLSKLKIDNKINIVSIKKTILSNGKNILNTLVDLECWDIALKIATHPNMYWQNHMIQQYAYMLEKACEKKQMGVVKTLLKEKINHLHLANKIDCSLYDNTMKIVMEQAILDENIEILEYGINGQEQFALHFTKQAMSNEKYKAAGFLLFPYCEKNIGDLLFDGFEKLKSSDYAQQGRNALTFLLSQSKFRKNEITPMLRILLLLNEFDKTTSIPNAYTLRFISELSNFILTQNNTENTLLDFFKESFYQEKTIKRIAQNSREIENLIEIVLKNSSDIQLFNFLLLISPNEQSKINLLERLRVFHSTLPIKNDLIEMHLESALIEMHQIIHAKNPVLTISRFHSAKKIAFELRNAAICGDCTIFNSANDDLLKAEKLSMLETALHLSIIYGQLAFAIQADDCINAILGLTKSSQDTAKMRLINGETQLNGFFAANKKSFFDPQKEMQEKRANINRNLGFLVKNKTMLPLERELFLRLLTHSPITEATITAVPMA